MAWVRSGSRSCRTVKRSWRLTQCSTSEAASRTRVLPCSDNCSRRSRPALILFLVDLIKYAAVGEMGGLRFRPAAKGAVDGDELQLWELRAVFLQRRFGAWTIEVFADEILCFLRIEPLQVSFG